MQGQQPVPGVLSQAPHTGFGYLSVQVEMIQVCAVTELQCLGTCLILPSMLPFLMLLCHANI